MQISESYPQSTKELFQLYAETKDLDLRNELVRRHMYIAELLARKYIGKGIEYDDIFQVASLGLIFSVERYDLTKGFEFSSFVTPTIIGEIKRYFRDKGWSIKVPRRIQELSKKVNDQKNLLKEQFDRTPTILEIAKSLDITVEDAVEALEASNMYTTKSLDFTIQTKGEESEVHFHEIVGKEDGMFLEFENQDFYNYVLKNLNPVEHKILQDRFFENKSQVEIASELQVSQMTISRMEKKIIQKFREAYAELNRIQ